MKPLIPLILILVGEGLAIYSELAAAKYSRGSINVLLTTSAIMMVAGIMLVMGYVLGVKYLANVWTVSAVSVAVIVIIEPLLTFSLFHEYPGLGASVGLAFGFAGLLVTLLVR